MSDMQKRDDDELVRRDEGGVSKLVYWVVAGIAFLAIGLLVVFLGPWLLAAAGVAIGGWLAWRIFKWWSADDEPAEHGLITHETSPEAELGSEIALEDLRQRDHSEQN
ncbi:MAG: hypothetical protein ACQEVA_03015 [Myxococcota bacterium]